MTETSRRDRPASIRTRLLLPIIASLMIFFAIDAYFGYHEMLKSINTAYDRTLLASARAIGDGVKYVHSQLTVSLPYPALEVFEADTRSRMVFRVSGFDGEFVSGYKELPAFQTHHVETLDQPVYAALVTFYEDSFLGETVRVAALQQPVSKDGEYRMVVVQVAETLELRRQIAQQNLRGGLLRQLLMTFVLGLIVWWIVGRGLSPLLKLRQDVLRRDFDSLKPFPTRTSRELFPVVEALNEIMARLNRLIDNRQRFVRDASHQLRTPLAALKVQVQNARQGFVEPLQGLAEIEASVDRATRVANQMLALAKVSELGDAATAEALGERTDIVSECRDIAVECSPLISEKHLDFSLEGDTDHEVWIEGTDWLLRELLRNLLSNAIRHTPRGGACGIVVSEYADAGCRVYVWDTGSGLSPTFRSRLFQPFATGDHSAGTGLGLVICQDICAKIGAKLTLTNRSELGDVPLPENATGCVARIDLKRDTTPHKTRA